MGILSSIRWSHFTPPRKLNFKFWIMYSIVFHSLSSNGIFYSAHFISLKSTLTKSYFHSTCSHRNFCLESLTVLQRSVYLKSSLPCYQRILKNLSLFVENVANAIRYCYPPTGCNTYIIWLPVGQHMIKLVSIFTSLAQREYTSIECNRWCGNLLNLCTRFLRTHRLAALFTWFIQVNR